MTRLEVTLEERMASVKSSVDVLADSLSKSIDDLKDAQKWAIRYIITTAVGVLAVLFTGVLK